MNATATRRKTAVALLAVGAVLAAAPTAAAEPDVAPAAVGPEPAAPAEDSPSSIACKQFSAALSYAASNYEDFAYASAGGGNYVDYANPEVRNSNVVGRTALREAASTAWGASTTPGLSGDISAPMQSWSLRATKLLLVMGVHGGGNTLNDTANALNADAHNTQMACALAGTPAV